MSQLSDTLRQRISISAGLTLFKIHPYYKQPKIISDVEIIDVDMLW